MIKLILFLFSFAALYAQETLFILPDHHSRLIHHLNHSFKNSSDILILTPAYHHSKLTKSILSGIKRGSRVTLFVHKLHGDSYSLVQYKGFTLYTSSVPLSESVILFDQREVCTTDKAIQEETFSSNHFTLQCSDNPKKIKAIRDALNPILKNGHSYLE